MGGLAGIGLVVFWVLNQLDAQKRKQARQAPGERIDWP
jgi:hypothetical protein